MVEEETGDSIGISYCRSAEQEERGAALPVNPHFSTFFISIFPSCTDYKISQASWILQQNPAPKGHAFFSPAYLKFCFVPIVQTSTTAFPAKPGCAFLWASCLVSHWESGRYGRGCICFISGAAWRNYF